MLAERRFEVRNHTCQSCIIKVSPHLKEGREEATEDVMAAKDAARSENNEDEIHEVADLWFHTLVLLSHLEEPPSAVLAELERRLGVSGLVEKANREN